MKNKKAMLIHNFINEQLLKEGYNGVGEDFESTIKYLAKKNPTMNALDLIRYTENYIAKSRKTRQKHL